MNHSPSSLDSASDKGPGAYAWVLVAILLVVGSLNYFDRLMITTMRGPLVAELSLNDKQFGMLTSVFLWVYASVSPLGGFLADRFSKRIVIILSLVCWSAATLLTGYAENYGQLIASRVLMGLSEACYLPAALALIADYHRGRTRSLANGMHMVGIYAGAALGGVGGYMAEAHGWRWGFKVVGGIGIAYGVLLFLSLRDQPKAEPARLSRDDAAVPDRPSLWTLISVGFALLVCANILVSVCNWTIYQWLPTFIKDHFKLNAGAAGLSATAYIQAASFAGVLIAGAIADAWRRSNPRARTLVPAIGYLLGGPFLILAVTTGTLPVAVVGLIVFGLARGAIDANLMPIVREQVDERLSATAYGVLNFLGSAAGGLMVIYGGAIRDQTGDLSLIFKISGAGLVIASFILFILRPRPQAAAAQNSMVPSGATPLLITAVE